MCSRGGTPFSSARAPSSAKPRAAKPSAFQLRAEKANHIIPRTVGDFGFLARPEEAVAHTRIERVGVVLAGGLHAGGGIRQPGIDARIVLRVHAESLRANLGHIGRIRSATVADHEGLQLRRVRGIAEALAAAP